MCPGWACHGGEDVDYRTVSACVAAYAVNILFGAVPSGGDFDQDRIGSRSARHVRRRRLSGVLFLMWCTEIHRNQSHRLLHTREGEGERSRTHLASSFQPVFQPAAVLHLIITNGHGSCLPAMVRAGITASSRIAPDPAQNGVPI